MFTPTLPTLSLWLTKKIYIWWYGCDSSVAIIIEIVSAGDAALVTFTTFDTIHLCCEMAYAIDCIYYVNDGS